MRVSCRFPVYFICPYWRIEKQRTEKPEKKKGMSNVKGRKVFSAGACALLLAAAAAFALQDGQCLTPPMGWNSWNYYGCNNINETVVISTARAFLTVHPANWEGHLICLKDAGYAYVNIDDCWANTSRDMNGRLQADVSANKFPHCTPANGGMKWLTDTIHRLGLKIGIYGCAGTRTCAGTMPGGFNNETIDAQTYCDWGFDYLKYDFCSVPNPAYYNQMLYVRMRNGLWAAKGMAPWRGPLPLIYSICEWGWNSVKVWTWGDTCCHLWRTAEDLNANWSSVTSIIDQNISNKCYRYARPGAWNDMDMLEVGNGSLTEDENQSHFSIWCMSASPLFLGNKVTAMSEATFTIVTNRELIAIDQDSLGWQGRRLRVTGNVDVWVKKLKSSDTVLQRKYAAALLNRGASAATNVIINWSDIGETQTGAAYGIRDLQTHTTLPGTYTSSYTVASVPAHGTVTLLFQRGGIVGITEPKTAERLNAQLMVRRGQKSLDIYVPVSNSRVQIFSIQGKELASFATTVPSWYRVEGQSFLTGTCLVQVKTASGILANKTVVVR
jgi:alpha-galactosidase